MAIQKASRDYTVAAVVMAAGAAACALYGLRTCPQAKDIKKKVEHITYLPESL